MTAPTLPVVLRRLRHDQRHFDRIAQTNQTIRQFRRSIKRLDLIPEVSQLTNRARQPLRTADRLSRAIRELRHLWNEIETFYRSTKLSDGLIGLRNAVEVALIVAQAAQHNRQSRGCHYRQDSVTVTGDRLI